MPWSSRSGPVWPLRRAPAPRAPSGSTGRRTAPRCASRVGCDVDEPLRAGDVERQRLLADHVLPRRQRGLGERQVEVVRCADVHDVDAWVAHELLGRVEGSIRAELGGRSPGDSGDEAATPARCAPARSAERAWIRPMNPAPASPRSGIGAEPKRDLVQLSSKSCRTSSNPCFTFLGRRDEPAVEPVLPHQRRRALALDPRGGRSHAGRPGSRNRACAFHRRSTGRRAPRDKASSTRPEGALRPAVAPRLSWRSIAMPASSWSPTSARRTLEWR